MKVSLNSDLLMTHREYVKQTSPDARCLVWLFKLLQSCFEDRFTISNVRKICSENLESKAGDLTYEQKRLLNAVIEYCDDYPHASKEDFVKYFGISAARWFLFGRL